jgi:hypothetical protein
MAAVRQSGAHGKPYLRLADLTTFQQHSSFCDQYFPESFFQILKNQFFISIRTAKSFDRILPDKNQLFKVDFKLKF